MIRERFGLHRGHVHDVFDDLLFEVALARAWKRRNESAIRNLIDVLNHNFSHAETVELKAKAMSAAKDPRFGFVVCVLHALAAFDPEKLRMNRFAKCKHVIVLQTCRFGHGASDS